MTQHDKSQMVLRSGLNGLPHPPQDTPVIVRDYAGSEIHAYAAGYGLSASHAGEDRLVYNTSKGQHHGQYADEWYEPKGVTEGLKKPKKTAVDKMTDKQKKALSEQAAATAKRIGYCNESNRVIAAMGLPVKKNKTGSVEVWEDDEIVVTVNGKVVEGVFK